MVTDKSSKFMDYCSR